MDYCPLCHQQTFPEINIPGLEWNGGDLFYLGEAVASFSKINGIGRQANLLEVCLRYWPDYVSYDRCIFASWPNGDEPDGDVMRALVANAILVRRKIVHAGLHFYGRHGGYKLWLPTESKPEWFTEKSHFRAKKNREYE